MDCIFCQIVAGAAASYRIWEDASHLAFLSIFPNTEGVTVVVPRQHYPSYVFDLPEPVMTALFLAGRTVARLLDAAFDDVGRTAVVAEGFGVDHVHLKLYPIHGTAQERWQPFRSTVGTFAPLYQGYVSSHDGGRAKDEELAALAAHIRGAAMR